MAANRLMGEGKGIIAKSMAFTLAHEGRGKEGRPGELYYDTSKQKNPTTGRVGIPTIGIGFNLNRDGAEAIINALGKARKVAGFNYADVLEGTVTLTDDEMDKLFLADVRAAHKSAKTIFKNWDNFSDDRKIALADMVLNLGATKFKSFSGMIKAINSGTGTGTSDWDAAAYEALTNEAHTGPSLWYTQVKDRRALGVAEKLRGRKEAAPFPLSPPVPKVKPKPLPLAKEVAPSRDEEGDERLQDVRTILMGN